MKFFVVGLLFCCAVIYNCQSADRKECSVDVSSRAASFWFNTPLIIELSVSQESLQNLIATIRYEINLDDLATSVQVVRDVLAVQLQSAQSLRDVGMILSQLIQIVLSYLHDALDITNFINESLQAFTTVCVDGELLELQQLLEKILRDPNIDGKVQKQVRKIIEVKQEPLEREIQTRTIPNASTSRQSTNNTNKKVVQSNQKQAIQAQTKTTTKNQATSKQQQNFNNAYIKTAAYEKVQALYGQERVDHSILSFIDNSDNRNLIVVAIVIIIITTIILFMTKNVPNTSQISRQSTNNPIQNATTKSVQTLQRQNSEEQIQDKKSFVFSGQPNFANNSINKDTVKNLVFSKYRDNSFDDQAKKAAAEAAINRQKDFEQSPIGKIAYQKAAKKQEKHDSQVVISKQPNKISSTSKNTISKYDRKKENRRQQQIQKDWLS